MGKENENGKSNTEDSSHHGVKIHQERKQQNSLTDQQQGKDVQILKQPSLLTRPSENTRIQLPSFRIHSIQLSMRQPQLIDLSHNYSGKERQQVYSPEDEYINSGTSL